MVEGGDSVMIAGVIVSGPDSKQIILRGIGPSLGNYGISFPLFDPNLTLYDAQGNQLAFNDNYGSNSSGDLALLSVNQLTPRDPSESAIVTTLNAGAYTVIMRGRINGVGLVEAFDISTGSFSTFTNISTRGKVEQNDEGVMIAGFIISQPSDEASSPVRVAIRALGPSLKQFGVIGALADPTMEVYHGFERILVNDSWTTNSAADQQELRNNNLAPSNTKEAALVTTLDPGSYTVIIRGKGNTTGVALAEVYRISP